MPPGEPDETMKQQKLVVVHELTGVAALELSKQLIGTKGRGGGLKFFFEDCGKTVPAELIDRLGEHSPNSLMLEPLCECNSCALVVKQPSSSHLVQPIAYRCPDLGLTPENDVCRTEAGTMRQDRRIGYPCRGLSTADTKKRVPPRTGSISRPLKKNSCPTRPTVTQNHRLHGRHNHQPT